MRKLSRFLLLGLTFVLLFTVTDSLNATHVVGGDLTYKCLGSGDYEVTLTVRRDCEFGEESFDETAAVGIFDGYGNLLPFFGTGGMILMTNPVVDTINTDLEGGCAFIGDPVCVTQAVYKGVVNLPVRNTGYHFSYQRCCKNASLDNIIEPLQVGSTYTARLLEKTMEECNSSPYFNEWPDVYICANQSVSFDFSATDDEGDSLVYSLCAPLSGATFDQPQPFPPAGPPYDFVEYAPPFSFMNPISASTPLAVNSETGLLTVTPDAVGQWLVGVCVKEYRDGELVTTIIRDFEYNSRICTAGPMASFDIPNPFCDGLEVTATNTSTDADSYVWTVDPDEGVMFDANAESPAFTFPGNGVYVITMEAFRDIDGCSSVISESVGVYNSQLEAAFTVDIDACVADSTVLNLTSTSVDPDYNIESWEWTISSTGFNTTASGEVVQVFVPTVDVVDVTLVVTSENGCSETLTTTFDADPLDLEFVASPMMFCQGDTLEILVNPNCDLTYTITPLDFVIFDDPADPCVISIAPQEDIIYTITVTDGICTASEELDVMVTESANLSIVGDTISCDGNIQLNVEGGLPGNQFEWSTSPDFDPIIGDMTAILDYALENDVVTIYVRVKDGTGCSNVASQVVILEDIDITYPADVVLCTSVEEEIIITNNDPDHELTIVFDDNDIIVSTSDSSVTVSSDDPDLNTMITFTVTNQFGCEETGTINVTAEQNPTLDFTFMITCGTLEMCFTNTTDPLDGTFEWDFGDLNTMDDTSNENNPCYTYPEAGTYEVSLTLIDGACEGQTITKTVEVPIVPEIEIEGEDIFLCLGEVATLMATTNVVNGDIVWTNENGDVIGEGDEITITGTNSTTITVTVTDEFGCEASDMINVEVYIFDASLSGPEIVCVDEEATITLTNNLEGDFTYNWEPDDCIISGEGTTEVVVSAQDTKEISVTITNNDNGCDTTLVFTLNVSVINKTLEVDIPDPFQCTEIMVSVVPQDDGCEYIWETGETEPTISDTIIETTTYTVTITDDNGCTLEQSITVEPQLPNCDETDVYLPNAFSPNGDNTNDVFRVRSNFIKTMDLVVFDRWGEKLFQSTDINVGWDGTFNGDELAPDVYAYCLIATCSNGAEYKVTGNVTLMK